VKIRGYRVELGEIENVLQANSRIKAAVVVARTGKDGDKELIAYLTGTLMLDITDIRNYLNHTLPVYMHPQYFVQMDHFPVTANGKIDKKRLPDPEEAGIQSTVEYIAPRNETEKRLEEIWREILDRENISMKDNFFELGGHSLKATRLVSQIRKVFDVSLTLVMLFSNPTIEGIACEIEKIYWASNEVLEMDDMEKFSV
jgi:acyl carrier protein